MMKVVFLFLGLLSADTVYEVVKIPVSYKAKEFSCSQAFNNNVEIVKNKNYKPNENRPMDLTIYKNKVVCVHWCKDKDGNFIP